MNILIVDDEELIRNVIKEYAINEGYHTLEASDGEKAIEMVKNNNIDGFSSCKEIKKIKNIPIIMLSARSEEFDKLYCFEMGIDDYITKPFSPKELMARIKAVLKRNNAGEKFVYNGLEIDYLGHTVSIDNEEIKLTPKEYEILVYLVKNKNIAVSRETILSKLWGYSFFGDDRTVDTHIKKLRNNLGPIYRNNIITVRNMGYKFEIK